MPIASLIHRRPVRSAAAALWDAERAFDQFHRRLSRPLDAQEFALKRGFSPVIDAVEKEDVYEVSAELPGVASEDLEILLEDGVLTLKGSRATGEAVEGDETDESANKGQRFERRIRFNAEIDETAVNARYVNGLLRVVIPKALPPVPEVRTIPVEVG